MLSGTGTRETPLKKGTRLPSRQKMQKPDSECANEHIINVIEVQMGFLSWIGNILRREKLVDTATGKLFQGSRLAAVSVLLAEPTALVGLWNSLAPVCHRRWGRYIVNNIRNISVTPVWPCVNSKLEVYCEKSLHGHWTCKTDFRYGVVNNGPSNIRKCMEPTGTHAASTERTTKHWRTSCNSEQR